MHLLNQMAMKNGHGRSPQSSPNTQPILFNPQPMVGIKRSSGVVIDPVNDKHVAPLEKKQTIKGKGREKSVSYAEFTTWKIYQDRLREVAVEEAEKKVYGQLWGNMLRLQKQCAEYHEKVTSMEITLLEKDNSIACLRREVDAALRNNPPGVVQNSDKHGTQVEETTGELNVGQLVDRNGIVLADMVEEFEKEHGRLPEGPTDGRKGDHPTHHE